MTETRIEPSLITTQADFYDAVDALLAEPVVAVDTESNSLYAYREQVCLIQFSIPGIDYLIDPLALKDISALGEVFASTEIKKVFHAAEYDLLVLKRDFDFHCDNMFDTMIAARILGRRRVGLGHLIEEEFGVKLQKKYQRANWGKRPLPPEMLKYASLDTHYLVALSQRLRKDLESSARMSLAEEDFRRQCYSRLTPPEPSKVNVWRISGVYDLSPQQVSILYQLALYRDKRARELNRPLFKVIGDKTLVAIAENEPASYEALSKLPGMTNGQMRRYGKGLLKAVREGQKAPPIPRRRVVHPDSTVLQIMDALRNWRKHTAPKIGVDSDIVLPRDILELIAYQKPKSIEVLKNVMEEVPYRFEQFGSQILSVVKEHT